MKIYVSKYKKGSAFFMWFLALVASVYFVSFHIEHANPGEILWILVIFGGAGIFLLIIIPLFTWKELLYVKISANSFVSFFFGKKLCILSRTAPIYYATFKMLEGIVPGEKEYVLLSNKELPRFDGEFPLIYQQDVTYQIVLPLNVQTMPYMDFENWHFCTVT